MEPWTIVCLKNNSELMNSWPLPSPNDAWHPIESAAVNATDNAINEHDYWGQDWGNPGKQHQTLNRYDD